ncbi:MAG TPA: glycosyltransferase family 39 protein [Streptosporangiaceae bacterium]|nr:glycosyltransferase family 39 protein [Streptosporangiaceae bacterium]
MSLPSALPLPLSAGTDAAPDPDRPWWQFWRSPAGQPPWTRPALLGIAAIAALLYARNITQAGLAPFYSIAVKSMSVSWKAFFYGAFDPKATITIDKLAGSFLPQALSARIFGFHPWSLALPQVIEGVISVLVMYRVVRRWAGPVPGLLAAGIFAATPIAASMFGHSMEDGALTMCLVLAADSWQRAVMDARLRSLIWAGVWVGLGFQAKMLQAWMVLPALGIGYLLAAPAGLGRRLWHLGVAGLVMLAVSLSWIALYTFTPAADRPYVDGSTDNSAIAMVFGYNGVERFGISFPGSVAGFGVGGGRAGAADLPTGAADLPTGSVAVPGGRGAVQRYNAGGFLGSSGGWTKLVDSRFGPEIGWLYPLALLTLIAGLAWRGRARRTDQLRAGLVMWGTWLVTFGVIYSVMNNIPHTAYMASLAPPLAALSGAGMVLFWRWYRSGSPAGWLLPAAIALELAWAYYLWSGYRSFLPWALPIVIAAGAGAIAVMVAARLSRRVRGAVVGAGLAAGVAAMLAAPMAWSASVLDVRYAGTSLDASAGPAGGFGPGGGAPRAGTGFRLGGGFPRGDFPRGDFPRGGFPGGDVPGGGGRGTGQLAGPGGAGGGILGSTTLTSGQQQLYRYVSAHRDGAGYLLAVQSWTEASAYILVTGQEVMPMGGFSGSVPEPTPARVRQLVASGQLRFFLLGGAGGGFGDGAGRGEGGAAAQVASWVESSCATVPGQDYGATSGTAGSDTLYVCGAAHG